MIFKKALATTSCFFVSAVLLSQVYSFLESRFQSPALDTSAFSNLAANIQFIASEKSTEQVASAEIQNDEQVTTDIIKVIDHELRKNIKITRYAVSPVKAKTPKMIVAKVEKAPEKIITAQSSEDLTSYEINNNDLIQLSAFAVERIDYSSFESIQLATTYGEELKDEVAVKIASTENSASAPIEADEVRLIQPAPEKKMSEEPAPAPALKEGQEKEDDLVMFDYSDKVAPSTKDVQDIDKKLYDRPLSSTVKKAISREIGQAPIQKPTAMTTQQANKNDEKITIDDQEIDLNNPDTVVYDYSSEKSSNTETEAFTASPTVSGQETQFVLRAKEVNLSTHKLKPVSGFEFVPDYDRSERISDSATGELNFSYSLSGDLNTQTGVLQGQGLIPTRVELPLGAMKGLEVPLMNEDGLQKFLQKQNLSLEGNLLMIALDDNIIDVEIDSNFGAKFLLDSHLKPLSQMKGSNFLLFAGVKTGNILIKYLLANKESAQKIVYVGDGEMYFEDPGFTPATRETYTFTTRNLLGQKKKELAINGELISFFNTTNTAKKKALSAYELKVPTLVTGMRKYLEFKHLKDSIFVGTGEDKEIEIPGNDFIGKILEMNQISSLKDRCIVQINLSKDLRSLTANGKNRTGEMYVETSYLDRDGAFSRDNFELAEKAFIMGDMEGQFSVKLDYTDGSSEFLKTFCSEGSYLVEQL